MAPQPATIIAAFERSGIIPVFYHDDEATCIEVMKACYEAGIRVFEFTNRGENARRNFAAMRDKKLVDMPDMYLGIGTIKSAADAESYTGQGADFIVSPITDEGTAAYCRKANILWIPGCMTPSEIAVAEKQEAPLVKLFPGNVLGPGFVKAIKPLFPNLKFMPTGGVEPTQESVKSWFDAGVVCVGMGSNLIPKQLIDSKDWAALKAKVMQTFAFVKALH
ncbi:bifunctional 4-hydroxy-2-oxoglutarate aldolase/2-dehydro-3-deoxy-phosphogluconate aldolase [Chitinophaga agrisoli]|uniref:Bifunctional 4-hydroxy-2-oxoglutarate aldolase/2-dehydro-3-deoxy-phosphogluconate aldolase n=1 Tax=Chitinophaga agrisoli TaxID=2607653 RepID=A0A5B2VNQ3_9BACT|nr:bifunctional 4-hydroxy-2-oxoglutarate aldolase/2-dehydro-3-deoxy-phosphogluconate aldolase [Chitinophaga agrisoli]KAA2240414.1 bifunctional 4-hydroxy-2-oxoglutarate aldolase/2-dehydro-3-deoxy-phosphogluconate aldolase [Chitinophaga agrisoli]